VTGEARNLPFPLVTDPEVLRRHSQRHIPNSITALHIHLARVLVLALLRCPGCGEMRKRRVEQYE
jgi:hypothetical protein